jgi:excisionase family DNA binding protein
MPDAESNLLTGFQTLIDRAVENRVRPLEETIKQLRGGAPELDEETCARVREQVLIANKTWLTRKEAAKYLNVSERSIAEWAARAQSDNPFPESSAGSEPRVKRSRIDEWADRERQKQRLKLAG